MAIERYRGGFLSPWNAFRELENLKERMEEAFRPAWRQPAEGAIWSPAIEVFEEEDKYLIKAELPGLKREDIDVSITKNVLTLKGERKAEKECKEGDYFYCERQYGSFMRSVSLPGSVDVKRIAANYRDGVLEIAVPKAEEEKEKKIDIRVG